MLFTLKRPPIWGRTRESTTKQTRKKAQQKSFNVIIDQQVKKLFSHQRRRHVSEKTLIVEDPSVLDETTSITEDASINEEPWFADTSSNRLKCPAIPLTPQRWGNEIAVVACGNFWNPQARIQRVKGVRRVVVGYTGGRHRAPTHDAMHDHCMALLIEFNPRKVSYERILQEWHNNDDPWVFISGENDEEDIENATHTRSGVYYMSQRQREVAAAFLWELKFSQPKRILFVDFQQVENFYMAEEMHQDYLRKQLVAAKLQLEAYKQSQHCSGLFSIPE